MGQPSKVITWKRVKEPMAKPSLGARSFGAEGPVLVISDVSANRDNSCISDLETLTGNTGRIDDIWTRYII